MRVRRFSLSGMSGNCPDAAQRKRTVSFDLEQTHNERWRPPPFLRKQYCKNSVIRICRTAFGIALTQPTK